MDLRRARGQVEAPSCLGVRETGPWLHSHPLTFPPSSAPSPYPFSASLLPTREAAGCAGDCQIFSASARPKRHIDGLLQTGTRWAVFCISVGPQVLSSQGQWRMELTLVFRWGAGQVKGVSPYTCATGNFWALVYLLFAWHFTCGLSRNALHTQPPGKEMVTLTSTGKEFKVLQRSKLSGCSESQGSNKNPTIRLKARATEPSVSSSV